ncbi:MAG: hypothetical protein ABEL76_15615 [Bradymonadaceae bacterium]
MKRLLGLLAIAVASVACNDAPQKASYFPPPGADSGPTADTEADTGDTGLSDTSEPEPDVAPDSSAPDTGRHDAGPAPDAGPRRVQVSWDFDNGKQGWKVGLSDYSHGDSPTEKYNFEHGVRQLPADLGRTGKGLYASSFNKADDLFMFLKHRLGQKHGLVPDTAYQITWRILMGSTAPSGGCPGIGGSPGEGVSVKAGGSKLEPRTVVDPTGRVVMNVDHGGNSTSGRAATVLGTMANGVPCDEADGDYRVIERTGTHQRTVRTDQNGELWLLAGTDSGFEGTTSPYYLQIDVALTPVAADSLHTE